VGISKHGTPQSYVPKKVLGMGNRYYQRIIKLWKRLNK